MNKYINDRLSGYFPITEISERRLKESYIKNSLFGCFPITEIQKRMLKDIYTHGTTHANMEVSQLIPTTRLEDDSIHRTIKEL